MKTLTEFPAVNLKNAAKVKQDLLAGGKTPEELPQAMGEALKLEGDRLNFLLSALEIVGTKITDLKRVIVSLLNEGEKAPAGMIQKENHTFLVEYYPPVGDPAKGRGRFNDGPPGDKSKGKRGKGRRGGKRPDQRSDQRPGQRPDPRNDQRPQKRPVANAGPTAKSDSPRIIPRTPTPAKES